MKCMEKFNGFYGFCLKEDFVTISDIVFNYSYLVWIDSVGSGGVGQAQVLDPFEHSTSIQLINSKTSMMRNQSGRPWIRHVTAIKVLQLHGISSRFHQTNSIDYFDHNSCEANEHRQSKPKSIGCYVIIIPWVEKGYHHPWIKLAIVRCPFTRWKSRAKWKPSEAASRNDERNAAADHFISRSEFRSTTIIYVDCGTKGRRRRLFYFGPKWRQ